MQRQRNMPHHTRRHFLAQSAFGLGGLAAARLLQQDQARAVPAKPALEKAAYDLAPKQPAKPPQCRAMISMFMQGGPSHIDLFDPKPNATAEVRGPFKPINTSVTGIRVSELMPRLAKQAHRYSIIRSVHHKQTQHNTGMYWSIVGRPYRIDNTLINPSRSDYPSFGTLVGWLARRDGYSGALPPYVITPAPHCARNVRRFTAGAPVRAEWRRRPARRSCARRARS